MPALPAPGTRDLLVRLVDAWRAMIDDADLQPSPDLLSTAVLIDQGKIIATNGAAYTRHGVVPLIEELLATDGHLRACCPTAFQLAEALENLAPTPPDAIWFDLETTETATDLLVARLFEADFSQQAFVRVFNLAPGGEPVLLPEVGASLRLLPQRDVAALTGEATPVSMLLPEPTGHAFLIFRGSVPDREEIAWVERCWALASRVVQALKYLKYGVVGTDCVLLRYTPAWVNDVRRYGIRILGRPRMDVQATRYMLTAEERQQFSRYVAASLRAAPQLEDRRPPFRRATATAGDYYEGHHARERPEDKLIDLSIALEAMFSPSKGQGELRFQIALRAAALLAETPAERREIFYFLRSMYDARSQLVHGAQSPIEPVPAQPARSATVTVADIARFGDLVRQAILRLIVLYLRGQRDRDAVHRQLLDGVLGVADLTTLRADSDFERWLVEQGL